MKELNVADLEKVDALREASWMLCIGVLAELDYGWMLISTRIHGETLTGQTHLHDGVAK